MREQWRSTAAQRWPWLAVILLVLALAVSGCGSDSSSSSTSASEPSAEFLKPKGKNKIAKFGEEASEEEREAVNQVVVENLEAREAADFSTQCDTLNMRAIKEIPNAKDHRGCPAALKKLAEPLSGSKEIRKDTMSGEIAALRVKGDRGYALYHGNDGKDYAVPLEKEDGEWKVSAIVVTGL
jgi:hypothetical protein